MLLDNTDHLSSLDPQALNDRDFAGHTPLDIAYLLNRAFLIEELEALGAMGDKAILESRGVGSFIENDKYVHLLQQLPLTTQSGVDFGGGHENHPFNSEARAMGSGQEAPAASYGGRLNGSVQSFELCIDGFSFNAPCLEALLTYTAFIHIALQFLSACVEQ